MTGGRRGGTSQRSGPEMSFLKIAGAVLVAVWICEAIVFFVSYRHVNRRLRSEARRVRRQPDPAFGTGWRNRTVNP